MERELALEMDGIPFRLLQWTDLSWLRGYGTVFRIMDQLPSGNLCFGVEGPYGRLFIKYAGARTVRYGGTPRDAVEWLKHSAELYARHCHPRLIPMLTHGPAGEGYVTIFPWQDACPLRPDPPSDKTRNQLRRLPLASRLAMIDGIFDLHAQLASEGLIAVDFTDQHVLVDLEGRQAWVCDIDLFKTRPAFNTRGRMPGSPRFLSPEEYVMGDPLNEDTTVYKLGALAFEFFGDNFNRARDTWKGPDKLYPVAERATREDRKKRYASVREFLSDWRDGVSETRL